MARGWLVAAQLVVAVCAWAPGLAQETASSSTAAGIWAVDTSFGPSLRGELTVSRTSSSWRAAIGGVGGEVRRRADSVIVLFPASGGEFRGALAEGGQVIVGFWIQPAGVVNGYPFASPLRLIAGQRNSWRGVIAPLDDNFALYLSIWGNADGTRSGTFRSPNLNWFGGPIPTFRVARSRDSLVFTAGRDTTRPDVRITAGVDPSQQRLTLHWPVLNRTLVLTRVDSTRALGLFPRLPRGRPYVYRAPPTDGDGWRTGRATTVGIDEAQLATLVQRLADTIPTQGRAPLVHSLLIARRGRLVLEEYFAGYTRERTHDVRSVGKTFSSVMLGAAMMNGAPVAPESTVAPLLLRGRPFANGDPRKQRITLAHLMTHSSGLACNDNEDDSPGNEDTMLRQRAESDYWRFMLDLPMTSEPGSTYAYCSGGTNLVGGALTATTKTWLPALFDQTIAQPLQFHRYYYNLMPTLDGYLGGGAFIRPRDLLKVGQAYLDGGIWNGQRIVPAAWVARSTSKQIAWPYQNENVSAGTDGYAWHLNEIVSAGRTYREYEANGNGGQLLMVVPELDLVVVFTAGNYGHGGVWLRFRSELLANVIIPAINEP